MESVPASVLIVGSGVFGLSTAWALTKRPEFVNTTITVVDDARGQFPPPDAASVDSSRIIRPDYSDPDYATLAALAQEEWRKQGDDELGGQGRYTETGFVLTADEPTHVKVGKKSGMEYTKDSWRNAASIAEKSGYPADKVCVLEDADALRKYLGSDGHPGDWGYLNKLSGWADAGKGMTWLYERVKATDRVNFKDSKVNQLVTEGDRVIGASLDNGTVIKADIIIVAAGAWTGSLVDLRGRIEATGQALGYIDITEEEFQILSKQPVVLNLTSGLFIIPPQDRVLKIAHHSFGYINPETVTTALPPTPSAERKPIVVSRPLTHRDGKGTRLPRRADEDLRRALKDLSPVKGLEERPWRGTRLCWYSDTRDGDWLVDWHPGWKGLFLATGDSGHGYKFLPVLGENIVDCLVGQGGNLGDKWKWKHVEDDGVGREVDGKFNALTTDDGSRGGSPGMMLQEELSK